MSFIRSTYTFALEWVQKVAAHFAVISRRPWRVVHAPHVIGRTLEVETGGKNQCYTENLFLIGNTVEVQKAEILKKCFSLQKYPNKKRL